MTFKITRIELIALRKLAMVSKALAAMLPASSGAEMKCLADTLTDVLDRFEVQAARDVAEANSRALDAARAS